MHGVTWCEKPAKDQSVNTDRKQCFPQFENVFVLVGGAACDGQVQ